MLLADATSTPVLSPVERECLGDTAPISIANRTLVLLHAPETKSPKGTASWLAKRAAARHFHIRPQRDADMRRIARIISGRAVGLVLAGGGAKGFAHVGVLKALEEAGIDVDFVGGTSIGAVMGMVMALGLDARGVAAAVHKAFVAHPKGNVTGDYNLLPLISLIKGRRSRDAMSLAVLDAAESQIDMEDTWKTFFVIASDYSADTEAVLTQGPLARNVIASYAIPGALPPVFIDGHMMFDGGTFNNFPVDVMAQIGAGRIIGVDLSTDSARTFELSQVPGTMALLRDKFRPRKKRLYRLPSVPETMLASSFITSMTKQKAVRKYVHLLFQPRISRVGLLDWKRFDQIVEAGYTHARDTLMSMDDEAKRAFR
jgi:NTE family protein